MIKAHCGAGDLDKAWEAATRLMEVARRDNASIRQYDAWESVFGTALARGDRTAAEDFLGELDRRAAALDAGAGNDTYRTKAAQ